MFEKRDVIIVTVGILTTIGFFAATLYFRSGAF